MASTLREIEDRVLAVMPVESTIDRAHHARVVAQVVFAARRQAAGKRQAEIERSRAYLQSTGELIRQLKDHMHEHRA